MSISMTPAGMGERVDIDSCLVGVTAAAGFTGKSTACATLVVLQRRGHAGVRAAT